MASSANNPPPPPPPPHSSARMEEDLDYFYALNANFSNFVTVKLSGNQDYHLWKTQMLCLMESYNMQRILDETWKASSPDMEKRYQSLVKGWIFGSINKGLLGTVIDLDSPKLIWEKLKSVYDLDPTMMSSQQVDTKTQDKHTVSTQTEIEDLDVAQTKTTTTTNDIDAVTIPIETKVEGEGSNAQVKEKIIRNKKLCKAVVEGDWAVVQGILRSDSAAATEAINSDGNTLLHITIGMGRNDLVRDTLRKLKDEQIPELINSNGSTALHIAAIVGNIEGADLLIRRNSGLLEISDHKGDTPLDKAYENMRLDTIQYLLKAFNDTRKNKKMSSPSPGVKAGVNLLVNAVSANQYDLATDLVKKFPHFAVENDEVLMALARTFPSGLHYGETLIYPIMDDIREIIVQVTKYSFELLKIPYDLQVMFFQLRKDLMFRIVALGLVFLFGLVVMLLWICSWIVLLILLVYFPFSVFYFLLWKVATRVVAPVKHIEKKKKQWEEAIQVLKLVCDEIEKLELSDTHRPGYYSRPVLEAARQNSYEVVDEILKRCPEAILYKDKNGHDIIQLAVIHRSEKIYNLLYIIGERKSVYRTIEDSSKNNMLHLAGKLAPSQKLKRRTGAAFQLQRELQWREEVEKLVFPTYITKENIFMETPDMVFTKEHENLVKEGEKWMKAVAESCSITAALITTIVFAAAITVPGGSNQETGVPLFTEDIAFTIFAVADAISLFASSTALLMFLSILTGRFAEQDFLVSLPRRLIIGLCTLMLSTTAMMVAFGATLFLVFCHRKPWMLAPICVLAFLPIASFGTLQIPLIVDLFRSTYVRIFGNQANYNTNRFNPNDIRLFFGK